MSSAGYILIDRGIWDPGRFPNEPFSEREAWIWMIVTAVWKPISIRRGGKTILLERGQLAYSQRYLARRWHWSRSHVRRYLQWLAREKMIELQPAHQPAHTSAHPIPSKSAHLVDQITICNYNKYQIEPPTDRPTYGTPTEPLVGPPTGPNKKEVNKNKKEAKLVFVSEDSPLWPAMVELWQTEHHQSSGPPIKNFGWRFPAAWVERGDKLAALYASKNGKG